MRGFSSCFFSPSRIGNFRAEMKMRQRLETRQPPFFLPRSKKAPNFPAQRGGLFVQKLLVSPPFTLPSLHSAIHIMHFTQVCAPVQCSPSPPKNTQCHLSRRATLAWGWRTTIAVMRDSSTTLTPISTRSWREHSTPRGGQWNS